MPRCDHCLIEFPEDQAVCDGSGDSRKVFCCQGCRGIYHLITGEGLGIFYRKRSSWTPGPPKEKPFDVAAFAPVVRQVGAEVEIDLLIDGIRCASCVWLNERILMKTSGVTMAKVNYATHKAKVRWDPNRVGLNQILRRIASVGYNPKPFHAKEHDEELRRSSRDLLVRFGTAAFFSSQLMLYSIALYAGYFQGMEQRTMDLFHLIAFLLTTPVLFYSGWPFLRAAAQGLARRAFTMDVLITAGALSAYGYSVFRMLHRQEVYFDTSAMIITLILLGRYIETGAKGRASEAISRLASLSPSEARVVTPVSGERRMTAVAALRTGDLIEVIPGERIPLDGIVREGASEADESMLTGESRPVAKGPGSEVFGGTVNLYGRLVFEVARTGGETVLARIIASVEDAQMRRAPIQSAADRAVGLFVPAILFLGVLTFAFWLARGAAPSTAMMNAVSVLVIACPCALGLAAPLAILVGTTAAASRGILIKGGDVIERAGRIDSVVLDKTGTITRGKPSLILHAGIGMSNEEALRIGASLERFSEHSIGRAIVEGARDLSLLTVDEFLATPGQGVEGVINGYHAAIGSSTFARRFCAEEYAAMDVSLSSHVGSLAESGATVIFLACNRRAAGVFAVSDEVRPEAAEAVRTLRDRGIDVALITGDTAETAASVGMRAGIVTVMARMSPTDKANEIGRLQEAGRRVLMVGDGINDAPALVRADVGVAMGKATDIAIESADMALVRADLRLVPEAIGLAGKTFRIIRQNIFWAFFYNAVAVPLAVLGLLHPIVAAGAMALSSLTVVGNSLRARSV